MNKLIIFSLFVFFFNISLSFADSDIEQSIKRSVDNEIIEPFYFDSEDSHAYKIGDVQSIDTMGYNDYSIQWYVDTKEYRYTWAKDTLFRFSRMEFYYKNKKIASFENDQCWTYFSFSKKKKEMCKVHKIGDVLALVFKGVGYNEADLPSFSIFLLYGENVKLIYNNEEEFVKNIEKEDKKIVYVLQNDVVEIDDYRNPRMSEMLIDAEKILYTSLDYPQGITLYQSPTLVEFAGIDYWIAGFNAKVVHSLSQGAILIPQSIRCNGLYYTVSSIADSAFVNCTAMTSVTIPGSVQRPGMYAFRGCKNLTSATLQYGIPYVDTGMFVDCEKLTSVSIPESVTHIWSVAFSGCRSLASLTLPSKLAKIEGTVFRNCTALKTITCLATTPPELRSDGTTFNGFDRSQCTLIVPKGCKSKYRAADGWKEFGSIVEQ